MNKKIDLCGVLLKKISTSHKVIAKERDKLQHIYNELEDVLYSLDTAQECFSRGVSEIESGLQEISKHL